jgi:3-methyladenine DNA glycosylase/8-oxoguanine DNA glycosylase
VSCPVSCAPVAPYSLERTVGQFARFPEERVDCVREGTYRRLFAGGGELDLLEAHDPTASELTHSVAIKSLYPLSASPGSAHVSALKRILALDEPIEPVYAVMTGVRVLEFLASSLHGLRRTIDPTPFEGLVHSIFAQLISIRGAAVVRSRFVKEFGTSLMLGDSEYWTFPDPENVQEASVDQLCRLGMTGTKARAILTVARLSTVGELDLEQLQGASDAEVIRHLVSLPGIGPWTAEWFLINVLGRMSIVPAGDLGVRRATGKWLLDGSMPEPAAVRRAFERFGEHAAYVAYYILSAERYSLEIPQ